MFDTFYPLKQVLYDHTNMCQRELRAIPIGIGRVVEADWEPNGLPTSNAATCQCRVLLLMSCCMHLVYFMKNAADVISEED